MKAFRRQSVPEPYLQASVDMRTAKESLNSRKVTFQLEIELSEMNKISKITHGILKSIKKNMRGIL